MSLTKMLFSLSLSVLQPPHSLIINSPLAVCVFRLTTKLNSAIHGWPAIKGCIFVVAHTYSGMWGMGITQYRRQLGAWRARHLSSGRRAKQPSRSSVMRVLSVGFSSRSTSSSSVHVNRIGKGKAKKKETSAWFVSRQVRVEYFISLVKFVRGQIELVVKSRLCCHCTS